MHVVVASHQPLPAKGYGGPPPRGLAPGGGAPGPGPPRPPAPAPRQPPPGGGGAGGAPPPGGRAGAPPALHPPRGPAEPARPGAPRLIVAGGWRPSFTGSVKYVGEVDGTTKAALLARARCLWNPAQWDEPFGLVTIEALLSGTPVLGTRRGALPELITPEVGALCGTLEEMIAAAATIHTRSPDACRALAVRRFTHLAMAEGYVRMYRCLLETGKLAPQHAA